MTATLTRKKWWLNNSEVTAEHEDKVREIAGALGPSATVEGVRRLFGTTTHTRIPAGAVARLTGLEPKHVGPGSNAYQAGLRAMDELDRQEQAHGCIYFRWPDGHKPSNAHEGDPPPEYIESRLVILRPFHERIVRERDGPMVAVKGTRHAGSGVKRNGKYRHQE